MPGFATRPFPLYGAYAALAAICLAAPPANAADPCAGAQPQAPQVKVDLKRGPPVYHTHLNREQIASLKGRRALNAQTSSWKSIGLTVADIKYSTKISLKLLRRDGNRICAALASVEATMGFDKLDVYISNNFRKGSCPYQIIYEHENKHVVVFQNTVARYGPLLRHKLETEARTMRPVVATSMEQAARIFKSRLHGKTTTLFQELNRALDSANGALDTPRNYSLEQARCDKWN